VNERRGVDDLDDRSELDRALAFVAEELAESSRSADECACRRRAKVFADLGDGGDVRDRVASELLFDRCDVIAQQVEDLFPVDGVVVANFPGCSGINYSGNS